MGRRPLPEGKRVTFACKLSETLAAAADARCAELGLTRSAWLQALVAAELAEHITAEILAEPGALTEIVAADAEIAAGNVVSGVEAVRALRPRRKPETAGRAVKQASPAGKAVSADRSPTARGASGRQSAGDCPHTRAKRAKLLTCPDCRQFVGG